MRPHRIQRHHELARDGRAVQLGSEQPEHVELTFAQRVDQRPARRGGRPGSLTAGQEPPGIGPGRPLFRGRSEQGSQRRALIDEDPDVTLRLSQRQRPFQGCQRSRDVSSQLVRERLQHQDLDDPSRPAAFFRREQEPVQEPGHLVNGVLGTLLRRSRQEDPGQRDVLELA